MRSILGSVAGVLLLGAATVASAQSMETGTVVRIDPQSKVVILDDGRMYRVTPNTVLVVDNQRAPLTALTPGQRVLIQSGEVVALQNGQYVTVPTATTGTVVAPPPLVAQAPATAVPIGLRQTFYGRVTDVDKDGEVKIKTDRDSFEIKVGPEALRQIKKGDSVTLDLTIAPPGAPAASPR
jgi:preprotein translocase subunit YajC